MQDIVVKTSDMESLESCRTRHGVSRLDLALELGVAPQTVWAVERLPARTGRRCRVSTRTKYIAGIQSVLRRRSGQLEDAAARHLAAAEQLFELADAIEGDALTALVELGASK